MCQGVVVYLIMQTSSSNYRQWDPDSERESQVGSVPKELGRNEAKVIISFLEAPNFPQRN